MKNRFFAFFALSFLILNAVGATFADTKSNAKQSAQLTAMLPASDAIMTFDAKRFLGDALPQILSGNQSLLAEITAHVDEVKSKTGIDFRQFEQVAVGVTAKQTAPRQFDFEPVILARGQFNANALIAAAKIASNGKYREEKVGGKSVYIFSAREIAAQKASADPNDKKAQFLEKILKSLSQELAVSNVDANTLAFGTAARVRQTLDGKSRSAADVVNLVARRPSAVMNFAAKLPAGMSQFLPLDNDELGKSIDAIQYFYGSMDMNGANAVLNLNARTAQNAEAQSLFETLEGLQMIGKVFLGGQKSADKQVYARMVENVKFARSANEISVDLQVPQSDINVLIGAKK